MCKFYFVIFGRYTGCYYVFEMLVEVEIGFRFGSVRYLLFRFEVVVVVVGRSFIRSRFVTYGVFLFRGGLEFCGCFDFFLFFTFVFCFYSRVF